MLGAAIERAAIALVDGGITLSFDEAGEASRRMLEREEATALLKRCAEELAGRPMEIRLVSSSAQAARAPQAPGPAPRGAPGPRLGPSEPALQAPSVDHRELLERARKEPGVDRLLREFGAQVIDIRPLDAPQPLGAEEAEAGPVEEPR